MDKNIESKINSIIDKSNLKDNEVKQMLKKTFGELVKYEVNLLDKVQQQVKEKLENAVINWNFLWQIETVLVPKNDVNSMENQGFVTLNVGNSIFFKQNTLENSAKNFKDESQFFLECAYEDMENICRKQYCGYIWKDDGEKQEFHYTLVPHYRFIKQEELLFKIAELYKITRPVIFSPYARRAVDIRIDDVDEEDFFEGKIDFKLDENGLQDKLIRNYVLMWNVLVENDSISNLPNLIPDDKNGYYQFFCDANEEFIYPKEQCDDICKYKDKIEILYHEEPQSGKYEKITINPLNGEFFDKSFINIFNDERFNKAISLRTKSDINAVLLRFRDKKRNLECNFSDIVNKHKLMENVILRYKKEHAYFKHKDELYMSGLRYKPCCCVNFYGEGIFLTDYVNYVLQYMEQNYPEFNWIGKIGR